MPPRPGPGWAPSELPEGQDEDEKTRAARCSSVTCGHGVCGFESLDENKDKKEKKKQPVKTLASLKTASAACAVIGCCSVRSAPAPRSVSVCPKARRGHPGGQSLSI